MRAWFRVVLPGNGVFTTFFVIYGLCYLPDLALWYYGGAGEFSLDAGVRQFHPLVILLTVGVYAAVRVFAFHPAFDNGYANWLRRTPWRYGLPLPMGPVHLVPQDVVIVGVLSRLGWWHLGPFWWAVPFVFAGTYLLAMISSFLRTGFHRHAYVIIFGLGGMSWLLNSPWHMAVLLTVLYGVALHGLMQCFKGFENWDWAKFNESFSTDKNRKKGDFRLGWPFDLLGPHREKSPTTTGWAAATAILAGWWVFGIAGVSQTPDAQKALAGIVSVVGMILAVIRLFKYIIGYAPPISFRGRFATKQWIIPRYDVVFVAPVLILLLICSVKWLMWDFGVLPERALSAVTAAYVFVALSCPPSLDEWRLTGSHRIVPAVSAQEMQQIP